MKWPFISRTKHLKAIRGIASELKKVRQDRREVRRMTKKVEAALSHLTK